MQVGEDPGAVGERLAVAAARPLAAAEAAVDLLELPRDGGEALRLGRRARLRGSCARAPRRSRPAAAAPRPRAPAGRARPADRPAPRRRPRPRAAAGRSRSEPGRRSRPPRARPRAPPAVRPERTRTRSRSASGMPGRVESGFVRSSTASQPGSSFSERSAARATGSEPECSSITTRFRFAPGRKRLGVDARREDPIVAGEALRRRRGGRLGGGDQRVDPGEQLLAQGPPRRIAEPVGREEARDAERLGVAQREVRDARQPRLEAVDDVEAALLEREAEVRADADRDAEAGATRDGNGGADRDRLGGVAARERATPCREVGRPPRRREHGDRVPQRAQLLRDPGDMLVDVVWQ